MNIQSVGIIFKDHYEPARAEAEKLEDWLKNRGVHVVRECMDARCTMDGCSDEASQIPQNVNMVVVLGGDGTLLGAARRVVKYGTFR